MSFSYEIKEEILKISENSRCCLKSELTAVLKYFAKINYKISSDEIVLILQSDNINILQNFKNIISFLFFENIDIQKNNKNYIIKILNQDLVKRILSLTGISINSKFKDIDFKPTILNNVCCKRAYLRLAFVSCGYICNPNKNYHIEFVSYDYSQSLELKNIMSYFNINSKIIKRKENFVLYIKEGEQIVDLLNIISAHKALIKLENIRILKDVRNNINRKVNCETANLNKTITASLKQNQDILLIKKKLGLDNLPPPLQEIANLRLEFPELSLKELAEKLTPPLSKSGANHRFLKIHSIANKLRGANDVKKNN